MARRLGRGLESLLSPTKTETADSEHVVDSVAEDGKGEKVSDVSIDGIHPSPFQSRTVFPEDTLRDLADSIRTCGVVQPIIVRPWNGGYQLLAGERRWRAARLAGLDSIPAIIRNATDEQVVEVTLVENINREDLNPIDRAKAYGSYITKLSLTQEEASRRLGHDRATIANYLRLLDLASEVQTLVQDGLLAMGHARALLGIEDKQKQASVAKDVVEKSLSVRQVEKLIRKLSEPKSDETQQNYSSRSAIAKEWEEELSRRLGTRVKISTSKGGQSGTIKIEFYSLDDFDRLISAIKPANRPENVKFHV
jgi:ParB family chromosome partitioning protein